ncbi:MAG: O-methyltransferase [Ardenticatenales bacterium]|nr:O-methyltransferase [Ardenticatenales bacterium]
MTTYNDELSQYITAQFAAEDEVLQQVREAIPLRGLPAINIKPEEGHFLQFLARANGAIKALEIGTLGGYSGIWIARGLVAGGRLITLEMEPAHAAVAREHFDAAGVSGQVEVMEGDAHELLPMLSGEAPFDFVFIDAEKSGYGAYFDWALENTRVGGIIAAHNAFQSGHIVGESSDESADLMRVFNQRVAEEPRVLSTIYPGGDGMVIAVKR